MAGNSNEVEQVVARTLRDSLAKLQQTTGELDQAVADLVSACASSKPSNSLPPMLRARSAAASLAASLEVLSKFVMSALQATAPAETELLAAVPRAAAPVTQPETVETAVAAHIAPAEPELESPKPEPSKFEPEPSVESAHSEPSAPVAAQSESPVPVLPEFPAPVVSLGPVDFTITPEAAASGAPAVEPPSFEPAFEPDSSVPTVAEPTAIEPVAAVSDVAEAAVQTAELYELATWKEPPAVAEADSPAPATEVEVPAPHAAAEISASEETEPVPVLPDVSLDVPTTSVASTLIEELPPEAKGFDVLTLSQDQQELHRRANRVAKVSMQDVKMLRPRDVALGKEHKDICIRLRDDIEKAHKEYDRRFHAILDHPVDYFYDWMVEILGDGDPNTLGEYPYPSPAMRR